MRKIIFLSIVALSIIRCTTFSLLTSQDITLKAGVAKFDSTKPMVVNIELDSFRNVPMLFDTGSSISFLYSDSVYDKTKVRKVAQYGKTVTADGKKFSKTLAEFRIRSPWFDSDNKVISLFIQPAPKCPTKMAIDGIIGIDAFKRSTIVLELNFDRSEIITHYENSKPDSLIFKDFVKIKSFYDSRSFYIYPEIFGKEQIMMFDTGNLNAIYLPSSEMPANYNHIRIIDGLSVTTAANLAGSETFILDQVPIKLGNNEITASVMVIRGINLSNVGLPFLNRFNWLIDFETNEIWVSKNLTKNYINSDMEIRPQLALIVDDKIKIVTKLREAKYNVGDFIKSVNGEEVVAGNNCRLLKKLNDENWENLKIEIE